MIELNLLPKEMRKQKKAAMPDLPVMTIAVSVAGVLIALNIALFIFTKVRNISLGKLQVKWDEIQPQKAVVDAIIRKTQDFDRRLKVVSDIATPELDYAELMSGLNQGMVPGVWLSGFRPTFPGKIKGKTAPESPLPETLELTGYALGTSEEATAKVARFIDSVKRRGEFMKYFLDVELQNINQQVIEKEEVMAFKLICRFKRKI